MPTTVKIHYRQANDITLRDEFALTAPRHYDETRELWDDGTDYVLPEGYSLGENIYGEPGIFDPQNRMCDLLIHSSGRPQLVSALRQMPVLKRAA